MFCQACGSQIQADLNFCNRCGAKVAGPDPAIQKSVAENLSSAMGYIGGFGLIAFIFVVYLVVRSGADAKVLIPISFFYLATLFGICFLTLRQIAELTGKSHGRRESRVHDTAQPAYLKPVTTAQLDEPRDLPISVTENTTRTLDEVMIERK
jgi:hypothetical protein